MPTDNQDDMDKSDKTTHVSAEKAGVIGDNTTIENQNVSSITINNYHSHKEPEAQSAADSEEPEKIPSNPYKGLAHFGPDDAGLFFGRDGIIDKLTATISNKRFTAIIGPSGSGKSSVVLAGVAPRLFKKGQWLFSYFRISDSSVNDPFMAMSQALIPFFNPALEDVDQLREAKKLAQCLESGELTLFDVCDKIRQNTPQKRLLLIADQFEELFTTGVTAEAQQKFITLIVETLNNQEVDDEQPVLSMVVTLRADFLEQAAADAALAKLIDSNNHIIGPMEKAQLRQAIEEPAKLRGVQFEAGLVDSILDDVGEAQGNLPLAEFALRLLWEKQHNKLISAEAYHAIGRVKGALSLHAQDIYESLNKQEQSAAPRIFTQLVKIGSGTEDTRRIALRTDFSDEDWSLLQRFADEKHRLIVTNKVDDIDTAEVVHEALIRHWPLLRKWVNEKRTFLTWLDEVRRAMEQWQNYDKSTDSLLRGVALGQAQDWLSEQPVNITANVETFINESERQQRKKIQNEKRRNLSLGLAALVITVVLAVLGSYLVFLNNTTKESEIAREKLLVLQSRFIANLSRQSTENGYVRRGVLLALEALPDYDKGADQLRPFVAEAEASLNATSYKVMDRRWLKHNDAVTVAVYSPDGARIVTTSDDKTARIWDSASGELLQTFEGHSKPVNHATFSLDGKRIVTASDDTTARVWDSVRGTLLLVAAEHKDKVSHAAFSPDGARFVTASADNTAKVWDSTSGKLLHTLTEHTDKVSLVAFSPDGARIVTTSDDKTARMWDSDSGELLHTFTGHSKPVNHAAFSPDGASIVTASDDKTARVWDSASGGQLHVAADHKDKVSHAAFSPDGARFVTASADNTAKVWDSASGKLLHTLAEHTDKVSHAAFSPNGARIVTVSEDKTARVWASANGRLHSTLVGHSDRVAYAGFNSDSTRILTASADNTARIWYSEWIKLFDNLNSRDGPVRHAAFSPDGSRIILVAMSVSVRDSISGKLLFRLKGHHRRVLFATFSPEGTRIVTAAGDNTAKVWDSASGELLHTLAEHTDKVSLVAFSPDGARIVTASDDKTARVWDSVGGELLHTFTGHTEPVNHAAFSPDGARIVTASDDRTARVWDSISGKAMLVLSGHAGEIIKASFSPYGSRIFSASVDNTVRVWDSTSGKALHILEGESIIRSPSGSAAAFSPDGTRIVSASKDGATLLWDVETGKLLRKDKQSGLIIFATFSPNGSRFVTASKYGGAFIWINYTSKELVDKFKQLDLPPLTEEERRDNYLD